MEWHLSNLSGTMYVRCKDDEGVRFRNAANLWKRGVSCFDKVQQLTELENDVAGMRA